MLEQAINDYLLRLVSKGYAHSGFTVYERILNRFLSFVTCRKIPRDAMFTIETLNAFQKEDGYYRASTIIRGFSNYLYKQNKIDQPIQKQMDELPQIYKEFLTYYKMSRQIHPGVMLNYRRTLSAFNDYLIKQKIDLNVIDIGQVDAFLAEYCAPLALSSRKTKFACLRGFLRYLHQECKMLRRDLAPLLVGAPQFDQTKPPKFLRPQEMQKLFANLKLSSPKELRDNAMIHLAYTLGLRPKEISSISLDDISFSQGEITLPYRKSYNPIKLPLPENTIKAIAAYIVGGRPESSERSLFLKIRAPHIPISANTVSMDIKACMR